MSDLFNSQITTCQDAVSHKGIIEKPCAQKLVALFAETFQNSQQTLLLAGGAEPEYIPADSEQPYHRIIFSHDYCESALHEIAHWCIAGEQRRLIRDYGYWYAPDGRTPQQQNAFEQVEVKPQALEWIFANACGIKFRVSADNLTANQGASLSFKQAIVDQAQRYCREGLNQRAALWRGQLAKTFAGPDDLHLSDYKLEAIQ